MTNRIGGIYKITNIINGKVYIGSTVDFKKREKTHMYELKTNRHHNNYLQNAYKKYGSKNIVFSILEVVENEDDLRKIEQQYIDSLNVCDRKIGYNLNTNANGGGLKGELNGWFGKGYLMRGENNHFYGKKHSNETRIILSEINKGKIGNLNPNYGNKGFKNPISKQIAQVDIDTLEVLKVWGASIDIFRELKYHSGNICQICIEVENNNVWKKYKGFYWCYEKDIDKIKNKKSFIGLNKTQVIQFELLTGNEIKTFNTIKEASIAVGVSPSAIANCCRGKTKKSGGYGWKYKSDSISNGNCARFGADNPNARKILQVNSKDMSVIKSWECVIEASNKLNISAGGIYTCLSNSERYTSGNFAWFYVDDYKKLSEKEKNEYIEKIKNKSKNKSTKVCQLDMDLNLLNEFESIAEASRITDSDGNGIGHCCKGKQKTAGGFKWMYKEDYDKYIEEQKQLA